MSHALIALAGASLMAFVRMDPSEEGSRAGAFVFAALCTVGAMVAVQAGF